MPCSGLPRQELPGATYLHALALGKRSTIAFPTGPSGLVGKRSFRLWPSPTRKSARVWTVRLYGLIKIQQGAEGDRKKNALGRSRGGVSTKIHALTDTQGRPLQVVLTPGQHHEVTQVESLLERVQGKVCIADAGYDSNKVIQAMEAKGYKDIRPSLLVRPTANSLAHWIRNSIA